MSARRALEWLRWWWPALVWAGLIFNFSTEAFSGERTSRFFIPLLHWLFPSAASETLEQLHTLIRKSAHVGEYFLFSLLLFRGDRGPRSGWRLEWAIRAVAMAAGWAGLDELHQAFTPSRGPSLIDVLIDALGAAAGQVVFAASVFFRARHADRGAGVDSANRVV